MSEPLASVASTTSTPRERPLITRLRRGKLAGSGGAPRLAHPATGPFERGAIRASFNALRQFGPCHAAKACARSCKNFCGPAESLQQCKKDTRGCPRDELQRSPSLDPSVDLHPELGLLRFLRACEPGPRPRPVQRC